MNEMNVILNYSILNLSYNDLLISIEKINVNYMWIINNYSLSTVWQLLWRDAKAAIKFTRNKAL